MQTLEELAIYNVLELEGNVAETSAWHNLARTAIDTQLGEIEPESVDVEIPLDRLTVYRRQYTPIGSSDGNGHPLYQPVDQRLNPQSGSGMLKVQNGQYDLTINPYTHGLSLHVRRAILQLSNLMIEKPYTGDPKLDDILGSEITLPGAHISRRHGTQRLDFGGSPWQGKLPPTSYVYSTSNGIRIGEYSQPIDTLF